MTGFWGRLRYAIEHWPIERPLRWLFNWPRRDNRALTSDAAFQVAFRKECYEQFKRNNSFIRQLAK